MYAYIELLENFIKFGENSFKIIFDRDDVKDEIIRLNTEVQQDEQGIKSTGEPISSEGYADLTTIIRRNEGLQVAFMDLHFSGAFHASWKVTVTNDAIIIDADDDKDGDKLFEIYGEDILGLTDESIDELLLFIQDVLSEIVEDLC